MKARRFNKDGLAIFLQFVTEARSKMKQKQDVSAVEDDFLLNDKYSTPIDLELPALPNSFPSKIDIGKYCASLIPEARHEAVCADAAFWSWLAAYSFDLITKGRTKIKEPRAYVASIGYQDFYRHLLLGPYFIYFSALPNADRVRVLLYDEPTTMNEVMVQVGSYQVLMQNPEIQHVVSRLYYDNSANRIKRGAGGKTNGAPRRLMDFFNQIELNFDLRSIKADAMMKMLPAEFDRFK